VVVACPCYVFGMAVEHVRWGSRSPHAKGQFWRGKSYLHGKWWLKEKDQQLFNNSIWDIEKRRTRCISVAGDHVEKW